MGRNIKNLISLGLASLVAVAMGWYVRQDVDFFLIKDVPVEIAFPETHSPIAKHLKSEILTIVKPVKKANIWKVDLSDLQAEILKQTWVKAVALRRVFPSRLSIQVTTEEAVLLYMTKKGEILPVLAGGEVLKPISPTLVPDIPFMKGKRLMKDSTERLKLIKLFQQVPQKGALRLRNITDVRFEPTLGLTFKLIKERATVHLGESSIQTKGLQVLRVNEYLRSQKQKARVIDASFSKKVLVRLRKQT